ncbi:drug/metabolite transporter (DMT)-like permease [Agromyces hippuratus]|uniref:Drug/metabolite transporter (DMT)-like permease n=1 Tax=Agromyces hippuratus TaxID=286438 RepID=A0A852WSY5_9MICO|nr:DMT family transporter [Agromyces hippuratus]NYG21056.1 drug/metabolite transporter (DMT)-like permease [Agromyces hippuratus]
MSTGVLLAVLGAALLHGSWNAIAKAIPARLVSSALIGLVYLVVGAVGCILLPLPPREVWPYLLISAAVQTLYLVLLTAAYAKSEFGRTYPLTRGIAVLGITLVSTMFLGERMAPAQIAGVAVVAIALFALSWSPKGRSGPAGTLMAVAVGITITAYSVIDGIGVRMSGEPFGYASWLFLIQGITIPLVCFLLARDRREMLVGLREHAPMGALGGILSLAAYTIVVWAQSLAPLAVVSALRETGVLAAGVIGYFVFREPFSKWRVTATVVAVSGIVAIRLGG